MRSCEEYEELISEFLDGELTKDDQIELMKHMSACRDCQKYFDDLVAMHEALEETEDEPVPEGFSERVMAKVRETKQESQGKTAGKTIPFPHWKRWAALAACCALAVGLWAFAGRGGGRDLRASVTSDRPYEGEEDAPRSDEDADEGVAAMSDSAGLADDAYSVEPEEDVETAYYENVTRDASAPDQTSDLKEITEDRTSSDGVPAATEPAPASSGGGTAGKAPSAPAVAPAAAPSGKTDLITAEDAKAIALAHAGLTDGGVTFTEVKLDWEDGKQVYDVEFYASGAEYDYEIDAVSGAVLKFDYDAESYAPATPETSKTLTAEEAKAAALAHAGLTAGDVTFTKAKLDRDDGKQVYDVEFYASGTEYDYEIDAVSGVIVKFDYDAESYAPATPETPQTLTAEDAKAAALAHAGLTAGDVTFTKAKLDRDDGKQVYDIEFYSPAAEYDSAERTKYDYEIDASSGAVLKYDYDVKSPAPVETAGEKLAREAAQELALAQVPGASAANVTKLKQDRDDGREIYEVEIVYGGMEYEMDLDAYTGAVLDFDAEPVH